MIVSGTESGGEGSSDCILKRGKTHPERTFKALVIIYNVIYINSFLVNLPRVLSNSFR